jgi:hypothetical protein
MFDRTWHTPADAAKFVQEPQLRRIIRKFAKQRDDPACGLLA